MELGSISKCQIFKQKLKIVIMRRQGSSVSLPALQSARMLPHRTLVYMQVSWFSLGSRPPGLYPSLLHPNNLVSSLAFQNGFFPVSFHSYIVIIFFPLSSTCTSHPTSSLGSHERIKLKYSDMSAA